MCWIERLRGKLAARWKEAGDGDSGAELVLKAWETGNLVGGLPVLEEAYGRGTRLEEAGGEHGWLVAARFSMGGRRRAWLAGAARVAGGGARLYGRSATSTVGTLLAVRC
jgi:hypothetical protein